MENKIIMVNLDTDMQEGFAVQYDYGQTLRIQGDTLPKAVEVHFSLDETGGESITRIGTTKDGVTEAPVPDSMLENNDCEQNYSFYAYVYVRDDTSGNTKHKITIHVKARSKPEIPGDIEEPELFGEVIASVNEAAERAEAAEEKAKASAEEAGNYAESANESAAIAEKSKEDALEEIGEKQQEAISSIQQREKASVDSVTTHTDNEIQRIREESSESEKALRQTINDASTKNEKLGESIQTADTTKTELDKSTELAGDAKTELDTSIGNAGTVKTALDTSISGATEQKQALDTAVEQAGEVNTSLGEQIGNAEQILESVAQIETNKEDIRTLKDGLSKNVLNDTKTKRSLEALWKLNQGISYQFETDDNKAYQKDVPSGAKLVSVKKIGGRTIIWNQIASINLKDSFTMNGVTFINNGDGSVTVDGTASDDAYVIVVPRDKINGKVVIGSRVNTENYGVAFGLILSNGYKMIERPNNITVCVKSGVTVDNIKIYPQVFDLTQMFGAGNEPSTPEEFEALFPEDYYPYNEGTLMSIPVNEVVEQGRNLLVFSLNSFSSYGITCVNNGDGTYTFNGTATQDVDARSDVFVLKEDTYTLSSTKALQRGLYVSLSNNGNIMLNLNRQFATSKAEGKKYLYLYIAKGTSFDNEVYAFQLEKASNATTYTPYHQTTYPIPKAILNLPGYGWSAGNVRNEVNFENKQYIQRVDKVDLGTLNWEKSGDIQRDGQSTYKSDSLNTVIRKYSSYSENSICEKFNIVKTNDINRNEYEYSIADKETSYLLQFTVKSTFCTDKNDFKNKVNGIMLSYELVEPIVTDITDIIDDTFQEPLEVESGGTLTFKNSNGDAYRIPVQSTEEYLISLAEVAK